MIPPNRIARSIQKKQGTGPRKPPITHSSFTSPAPIIRSQYRPPKSRTGSAAPASQQASPAPRDDMACPAAPQSSPAAIRPLGIFPPDQVRRCSNRCQVQKNCHLHPSPPVRNPKDCPCFSGSLSFLSHGRPSFASAYRRNNVIIHNTLKISRKFRQTDTCPRYENRILRMAAASENLLVCIIAQRRR